MFWNSSSLRNATVKNVHHPKHMEVSQGIKGLADSWEAANNSNWICHCFASSCGAWDTGWLLPNCGQNRTAEPATPSLQFDLLPRRSNMSRPGPARVSQRSAKVDSWELHGVVRDLLLRGRSDQRHFRATNTRINQKHLKQLTMCVLPFHDPPHTHTHTNLPHEMIFLTLS